VVLVRGLMGIVGLGLDATLTGRTGLLRTPLAGGSCRGFAYRAENLCTVLCR
jgi:hypothetical protein